MVFENFDLVLETLMDYLTRHLFNCDLLKSCAFKPTFVIE